PGPLAFLLSLPWLVLTGLIALAGTFRFLTRPSISTPMVAMDIGLVMIGVTGLTLTLRHLGIGESANADYRSIAFLVPVIAAESVRQRNARWWLAPLLAVAVLASAIAIAFYDGPVELAAYGVLALSCGVTAVLLIRVGADQPNRNQASLLTAGVLAGLGAGFLAAGRAFAYFEVTGDVIEWMQRLDGPLVAAGLAAPALVGLVMLPADPPRSQRRTFFHVGPPTKEQLSRLVEELEEGTSKADLNPLADEPPVGYRLHRITRAVPDFENSCEALWTWAGHEAAGIELTPEQPPILIGKEFVSTVPLGPFTITTTGRVAALISDTDHYGFVYSTLDHHPLIATEAIILDKSTGRPTITISTIWRANCVAAKLIRPFSDKVLGRLVGGYMNGIAEAEAATIGARMMDVMSDMSKRQYEVSRDAIRAESTLAMRTTTDVLDEEVSTQPLSEFEALFARPLRGPEEENPLV
ncbi:MAG: YndJ family transporter, partial [Acidimicrobiales bacterium]|nr:YndJ family transporter [Acidimicrobiales bacterium]